MQTRQIIEIHAARPSRDGDGVAIQRITGMQNGSMDPILMLDELYAPQRDDFGGGFPAHPHRGMQTLTYMKEGGIIHEDNQGNRGEIRGGGAQWMSAGRGIIHSEMPTADSEGLHGFQIWINLPGAEKMSTPRYRDVPAIELVRTDGPDFHGIAIAGRWQLQDTSVTGPLHELAERAALLDLHLDQGAQVRIMTPASESLLGYVYGGSLRQEAGEVGCRQMLVTSRGDFLTVQAGAAGAQLLLLRGEPLGEPVAQYGPFVMNTREELEQALRDYQSGRFGQEDSHA
jgi:redox-sensitive bicupin YhaK (pirin superfamily)